MCAYFMGGLSDNGKPKRNEKRELRYLHPNPNDIKVRIGILGESYTR